MTKQDAISFLSTYQPLPSDAELSQNISLLEHFDKIRIFFIENYDEDCIPLFLNCFGDWDGLGVYQLVEDVLQKFAPVIVIPHLHKALQSESPFVKYWNAQISAIFPDSSLITPLSLLLDDQEYDIKSAAVFALNQIGGQEIIRILHNYILKESDIELKQLATDVIFRRC
jgi:HEAT repeat protein